MTMVYSRPGSFVRRQEDTIILPRNKPLPLVDTNPREVEDLLVKAGKDFGLSDNDIALAREAGAQAKAEGATEEESIKAAIEVAKVLAHAKTE